MLKMSEEISRNEMLKNEGWDIIESYLWQKVENGKVKVMGMGRDGSIDGYEYDKHPNLNESDNRKEAERDES